MIIIGNGRMITREDSQPFLEDGAVVLQNHQIVDVGTTNQIRKIYQDAEFIDASGGVIMPGLINTHEHCYSAMARGLSIPGYSPTNFLEILQGMWWKLDRSLSKEQVYLSALVTYVECIQNGVTTVFDHHASYGFVEGSLFTIAKAAKEAGIRSCLCYEVSDREGKEKRTAAIKENVDFIHFTKREGNHELAGTMGLHASFTLSNETLEECVQNNPKDSGFHIHIAEGIEDLQHCLKHYGKRVVDRLFDFNILGSKTIAAHCIYLNQHEMELIKATNTCVVHNPESNMGNACGCPPAMEFMKLGVTTGLGTDGYTNDMFESYCVANLLHKHFLCNPNVAWSEIPWMLFEGNAQIANRYFPIEIGKLKKGAAADVIVLDYHPFTPMTETNYNGHILFGMKGRMVTTTICNGKVLMKDRRLQNLEEERIYARSREEAKKLWATL